MGLDLELTINFKYMQWLWGYHEPSTILVHDKSNNMATLKKICPYLLPWAGFELGSLRQQAGLLPMVLPLFVKIIVYNAKSLYHLENS